MMLSFINFLNYLNKNPDSLNNEQKECLHKLLFCQTHDTFVYPRTISKFLNTKNSFGTKVLLSLSECSDFEINIQCNNCKMDQVYSKSKICENCYCELIPDENNISMKIEGLLSDREKLIDDEETVRNEQLRQIISTWKIQKYIIYLLIDVSNSESIQDESDVNYIKYLETLRSIIKNEAMHCVKGEHLYFGEIGDCFKIALSNIDDVIPFINKLAETHYLYYKTGKYPKAVEGLSPYPCLKLSAQLIELQKSKNPKDLLCKTLNNSLDFNYSLLTKLFRLDGKLKLKYENVFNDKNKMCAWIFDKLANKINLEGNVKHIEAKKHKGVISKADVMAFTFPNGIPELSEDPNLLLDLE